ncbi:MAG: hypothetical protein IJW86_04430 [Clostridia bacterium]|nr:hypothetical protein [Clostridia bacterium]
MDNIPENTNEVINENANEAEASVEAPKKKNKKGLLIGIFAALALIIVASLFMDGDKLAEHDYIIAENKKAIYLIDAANPQTEPVMIDEIKGDGGYVADHYINKDKTKILYANKAHEDKENFDTYYELWLYDITSGEKSLIDENIYMHCVNEAFDTVTYFKGKEGELWQKKTDGEAVKLYDGLMDAWVSDDLQTIIYTDTDKNTYAKHADAEPMLLGNDITALDYNENAILFAEGKKLVKYENGEKKIITEKYSEMANMSYYDYTIGCEGGYFLTEKNNIDVEGSFVDDMEESDKNIKVSDVEAYAEKLVRDALRLELAASKEWSLTLCDLYYYDGNEAVLVCENIIEMLGDASYYSAESSESIALYMVLGEYELPKLVMSEFYEEFEEEYSSLSQVYYDALKQQSTVGFAKGGKHMGTADIEGAMNYVYDKANTTAYVLTEKLGDGGEFDFIESYYTIKFGEDSISEPELYAEDVSSEITEVVDGKLLYGKYDDEDEYMYIYKGEELIAERVAFTQWLETDMLYVGIEGENEDVPGKIYSDGKFTEYDGLENYEMTFATEEGNIICYNYYDNGSQIVVAKDGKLTTVAGDSKYIEVYVPFECDNGYELSSPLFFGSLFGP